MLRKSVFFNVGLIAMLMSCSPTMPEDVEKVYETLSGEVLFNIDIKPILTDRCYLCHGPDAGTRKAGMRLDTKEGLYAENDYEHQPFVAGNLNSSEAIRRILSDDPEIMMPPPDSRLSLSAEDKAKMIKWVEQGAEWKEHWAFIYPEKKKVPSVKGDWPAYNEIDHFVQRKLAIKGLQPSPEADKDQLLRRVTMDLTGLPPTLQEMEAFRKDQTPDAYEKVVDRLLQTKSHAERMTLEWLDVARYADSHGFHADGARTAWPWRDWVIAAFEKNMPYDQFVTEQLAGDLMPNPTREQIIATAFNRNHPMTGEGGVVDEEFRMEYVANRTATLGTAFMGLTLECAKCHDHKFDPISQKEYFQVSAFFNNMKEIGMTGDDGEYGPIVSLTNEKHEEIIDFVNKEVARLENDKQKQVKSMISGQDQTSKKIKVSPALYHGFETVSKRKEVSVLDGNAKTTMNGKVDLSQGISGKAAVFDHQEDQFKANGAGLFDSNEPFSVAVWIYPKAGYGKTKIIVGNAGEKNQRWRGWEFGLDTANRVAVRLNNLPPHNYLHVQSDEEIDLNQWTHLIMTYDGSLQANGISVYKNGQLMKSTILFDRLSKSMLPMKFERVPDQRALSIGKSYRIYTGDNGIFRGQIDELAIYNISIPESEISSVMQQSQKGVAPLVSITTTDGLDELSKKLMALRKQKMNVYDSVPELMVMEEMTEPRKTFILNRGEYDQPTEAVKPGTVAKVMPFGDQYEPNRLGLSEWLFAEENPLTSRVAVNRYWQMIFGAGIVTTAHDFGNQGALPTHPELLDWLAIDFVKSGWDLQYLLKKMVMSATYRQSSTITPQHLELDKDNRWLARGSSYRWPAELIRDNALASSGLLNHQIGGQSARPYQPPGLWIELGNFSHDLKYFKKDTGQNQYRKSMYTFIRRTSPPPFMTIFDAPNRENCTVYRERTNTPLQALVLLNDPQFIEASKALAYRLENEGGDSLRDKIITGFQLVLSRKPAEKEISIMEGLYRKQLDAFSSEPARAKAFLEVGDFVVSDMKSPTELAALTVLSSTLFNLDEVYTKR